MLFICTLLVYGLVHTESFMGSLRTRVGNSNLLSMSAENFDALLFDCDGVIAETERDVHRISFNRAFKEKGLVDVWDEELYGELLKTGGGKERMTKYFDTQGWPSTVKENDRKEFVADLHKMKTGFFNEVVESGVVELRPGVMR